MLTKPLSVECRTGGRVGRDNCAAARQGPLCVSVRNNTQCERVRRMGCESAQTGEPPFLLVKDFWETSAHFSQFRRLCSPCTWCRRSIVRCHCKHTSMHLALTGCSFSLMNTGGSETKTLPLRQRCLPTLQKMPQKGGARVKELTAPGKGRGLVGNSGVGDSQVFVSCARAKCLNPCDSR